MTRSSPRSSKSASKSIHVPSSMRRRGNNCLVASALSVAPLTTTLLSTGCGMSWWNWTAPAARVAISPSTSPCHPARFRRCADSWHVRGFPRAPTGLGDALSLRSRSGTTSVSPRPQPRGRGRLPPRSVFRIDHYLGKETVQNLLALRFSNQLFEPLWNSRYVNHVQITMAEDIGVGGRAGYYDGIGAARDVIQNHLLQLRRSPPWRSRSLSMPMT